MLKKVKIGVCNWQETEALFPASATKYCYGCTQKASFSAETMAAPASKSDGRLYARVD